MTQMDDPITHYCFRCEKYVAEGSHTCRPASSPPPPSPHDTHDWPGEGGMRVGIPKCKRCGLTKGSLAATKTNCPATPSSPPAELTEALDELLAAAYAFSDAHAPFEDLEGATERLRAARSALVSLYNRQREEVKYLNAANDALSSRLERLKAEQITDSDLNTLEAAFALLENGEDGRDHDDELDAFDRLLTKLRESEDKP